MKNTIQSIIKDAKIETHILHDDGVFPNNERLPVVIYKEAIDMLKRDPAAVFENLFRAHDWGNSWRNGIFSYHHYHSTAHEVLGIYRGTARVQLGGPNGIIAEVKPGEVIIIPAGVAHKNLGSSDNFSCVGAYPEDQNYDMNYGRNEERPKVLENIKRVPLPVADPVYGSDSGIIEYWSKNK